MFALEYVCELFERGEAVCRSSKILVLLTLWIESGAIFPLLSWKAVLHSPPILSPRIEKAFYVWSCIVAALSVNSLPLYSGVIAGYYVQGRYD
jgi:hypothetical protein